MATNVKFFTGREYKATTTWAAGVYERAADGTYFVTKDTAGVAGKTYYVKNDLPATQVPGQVYFATQDGKDTGTIYYDYNDGSNTRRVKMNGSAESLTLKGVVKEMTTVDLSNTTKPAMELKTLLVQGTSTTDGIWTGSLVGTGITELYDGLTIDYWVNRAGRGASAGYTVLQLTLDGGSGQTGASPIVNCYFDNQTRLSTHIAANTVIRLTYRDASHSLVANTPGWWVNKGYNIDTITQQRTMGAVTAAEAITAGYIIGNKYGATGYKHLAPSAEIDISYPIMYAGSNITAAQAGSNNFFGYNVTLNTTQFTGTYTRGAVLYAVGTLNGNKFTLLNTNATAFTTTVPTSAPTALYYYLPLGIMTSTTTLQLFLDHPLFSFMNGSFQEVVPSADRATKDSAGNDIRTTYVSAISGSGNTTSYTVSATTKGNVAAGSATINGATASAAGLVTTGAQTWTGAKTLDSNGSLTISKSSGFVFSGIETATANQYRPIWYAHSSQNGCPVIDATNFQYNPGINNGDNNTQGALFVNNITNNATIGNGTVRLYGTATRVSNNLTVGTKLYDGSSPVSITASDLGLSQALVFRGLANTSGDTDFTMAAAGNSSKTISGATVKIAGANKTPQPGDVVIQGKLEYLCSAVSKDANGVVTGSTWQLLGDEDSYEVKGVAQNLINGLDSNIEAAAGYFISKVSITNGKLDALGSGSTATAITPKISASAATADATQKFKITVAGVDSADTETARVSLTKATTGLWGVTKLTSTISDNETLAITPKAVNSVKTTADNAMPKSGGTFTGAVTYNASATAIFNASATFNNSMTLGPGQTFTVNGKINALAANASKHSKDTLASFHSAGGIAVEGMVATKTLRVDDGKGTVSGTTSTPGAGCEMIYNETYKCLEFTFT